MAGLMIAYIIGSVTWNKINNVTTTLADDDTAFIAICLRMSEDKIKELIDGVNIKCMIVSNPYTHKSTGRKLHYYKGSLSSTENPVVPIP